MYQCATYWARSCVLLGRLIRALVQKSDYMSAFSHLLDGGPTLQGDAVTILKIKDYIAMMELVHVVFI